MSEQKMTLEEYKQQVEDYLTNKLGVSTTVVNNWMKEYETEFQWYLDDGLPVAAMATVMQRGF